MKVTNKPIQAAAEQASTKWLEQYLQSNLPLLSLPSANYQNWFDDFIEVLESRGLSNPSQQKNYLTDVRNAIKAIDPNHKALDVVKFDRQTWIKINQVTRDRTADRITKYLEDPEAIVDRAKVLLGSYVWSEIAAGLAVVTGRRSTEIIKTAQFQYKTKYSVIFTGSLKRRGESVECVFEIPTLCEAELVVGAIANLRTQLGDEIKSQSKRQISSRYSRGVASKCDRFFDDLVPPRQDKDNLYTHLFRSVYATIASYWYCPPTIPEMEFKAAIQGHYKIIDEEDPQLRRSLAATSHYLDYKISDGADNNDGRLGVKLPLPGVKVIEQFQHANRDNLSAINQSNNLLTTTKQETKIQTSLHNSTMSQPSSTDNSQVVIPNFLLSRFQAISERRELSQLETIKALFAWTEVGLSLCDSLELDEKIPEALFTHVEKLRKNPQKEPTQKEKLVASDSESNTPMSLFTPVEQKQMILTAFNSVELLSKALIERESYLKPDSLVGLNKSDRAGSNNHHHEESHQQSNRQNAEAVSFTRKRDSSQVTDEKINSAIDAVMEFNNAPNRPHKQKFRLSVKPLADLTERGTNSVSAIFDQRREEIDLHHQKHQLSTYHNRSRKDENGNDYPTIDTEPEIHYYKLTEIPD